MKKNIKKSTFFTIIIAVVFFNITSDAHASELQNKDQLASQIGGSAYHIQNSGDNGIVSSQNNTSSQSTVQNNNTTSVGQNIQAEATTGHNVAERNIAIGGNAGEISTGNAGVLTTATIQSNSNGTVAPSGVLNANPVYSSIGNSGNNFTSQTSQDQRQMTMVQNQNKTTISQNVDANANTGENNAPRNISIGGQSGVITTGNAYTSAAMLTSNNGNVALVGGQSNGNGPGSGASIVMQNTGDRPRLSTQTTNQQSVDVNNLNLLAVRQQCANCIVDTGHNTANRNINTHGDAGVIQTGNALIGMGITQTMNAKANTGYNEASRNIAIGGNAGIIQTGSAYILTALNAFMNSNNNY